MDRLSRRQVLALTLALTAVSRVAQAATEALRPTPRQTEGPFYPVDPPRDADNRLIEAGADGTPLIVQGRVLDVEGNPIPGAVVEIWQCDARGIYHHPSAPNGEMVDPNFDGFGRTETDAGGTYRFLTIRPVPYPGRTPHIHFAVEAPGHPRFVTQMYVEGEPLNARDGLYGRLSPEERAQVTVDLRPAGGDAPAELAGTFDIVLRQA